MSFNINKRLGLIDNFQFLSSFLDSLVKNSNGDNVKYLSQEFDKDKLDLVRQKRFYPYEFMTDFETFKEQIPSK